MVAGCRCTGTRTPLQVLRVTDPSPTGFDVRCRVISFEFRSHCVDGPAANYDRQPDAETDGTRPNTKLFRAPPPIREAENRIGQRTVDE